MTSPAQEIAALGEQRKKRGPYKKRPLSPFEEKHGSVSRQGQHPKKQTKSDKALSRADSVPDTGTSVPDLGTMKIGTVDSPDPKSSPRKRVAASPRRAQDLSGAIGKDLHSFTDVSWKEFLTLIANGARKPDLLHKMGITNASFNVWLSTTAGAAAEYENARLQWVRRAARVDRAHLRRFHHGQAAVNDLHGARAGRGRVLARHHARADVPGNVR